MLDAPSIRETVSMADVKRGYHSIKAITLNITVLLAPKRAPDGKTT
jgi:hypothetical protein